MISTTFSRFWNPVVQNAVWIQTLTVHFCFWTSPLKTLSADRTLFMDAALYASSGTQFFPPAESEDLQVLQVGTLRRTHHSLDILSYLELFGILHHARPRIVLVGGAMLIFRLCIADAAAASSMNHP